MKDNNKKSAKVKHAQVLKKKTFLSRFGYSIIIALTAFALYANTINHKYVLDDYGTVSNNNLVREGVKSIPEIMSTSYRFGMGLTSDGLYRPLSLVIFALEWQIAPSSPSFNHFVNIIFYVLTSVVLFIILRKLLASYIIAVPLLITLLWTAHPIHTEVVANIKSLDEILSFLFSLLVVNYAIAYNCKGKIHHLVLLSFYFLMALLSKENAVSLLLIVPLTIYFFSDFNRSVMIRIGSCLILIFLVYAVIRFSVTGQNTIANLSINDNIIVGARNVSERFGTVFFILGYYLYKLLVPLSFSCDYSYNQIPLQGMGNVISIISFLFYAFMFFYSVKRFIKKDLYAFGILFYLLSLVTVSNLFFLIGSTMAERFLFMPSLGFCIVLVILLFRVFGIHTISEQNRQGSFMKFPRTRYLIMLFSGIIFFYSYKTVGRNSEWNNNLSLFSSDVEVVPNSSKVKYYYANEIISEIKRGEISGKQTQDYINEAHKQLYDAIKIDPKYDILYNTFGLCYNLEKKYSEAKLMFKKAVLLNPKDITANNNLGNCYFRLQQYDSAIWCLKRSVELDPNEHNSYNSLAGCYFSKGDYERAIANYLKSISLNGNNSEAYVNLAITYFSIKKYDEAINNLHSALKLKPGDIEILKKIEVFENARKNQ